MTLTELVDAANITPGAAREALTRHVILWCVESFGHFGGDLARSGKSLADAPALAAGRSRAKAG